MSIQRILYILLFVSSIMMSGTAAAQWGREAPGVGGGTSNGPSLAVFNDRLFAAWKGVPNDTRMFFSSFDGANWSAQKHGVGVGTSNGPSLAAFNGRLFAAWKGVPNDTRMFFASYPDSPSIILKDQGSSVRVDGHGFDSEAVSITYQFKVNSPDGPSTFHQGSDQVQSDADGNFQNFLVNLSSGNVNDIAVKATDQITTLSASGHLR